MCIMQADVVLSPFSPGHDAAMPAYKSMIPLWHLVGRAGQVTMEAKAELPPFSAIYILCILDLCPRPVSLC